MDSYSKLVPTSMINLFCFFPTASHSITVNHTAKLRAFADYKINVTKELNFVLGREENIVEKGENPGNQHFLLFPQCFLKASLTGGNIKVSLSKAHFPSSGTD